MRRFAFSPPPASRSGRTLSGVVLVVVALAFLPSVIYDYATMDQWRAFRYGLQEATGTDRLAACSEMIPQFYAMTGRPLVWLSECIEHATVGRFEDFSQLRLPMLALVLLTVFAVGWALNTIIRRPPVAFAGAALVVMTPAFSFMALQGATAGMVVASVPLSAASFVCFHTAQGESKTLLRFLIFNGAASVLFFVTLLIYPAWGFLVVSFSVVAFLLSTDHSWKRRYTRLGTSLTFIGLTSLVYYVIVRAWVSSRFTDDTISSLGSYEVNADLSVGRMLARSSVAFDYFLSTPPTNVAALSNFSGIVIAAFALLQIANGWRRGGWGSVVKTLLSIGLSILLMLTFAIGPWLVSGMRVPETRHVLVWSVFVVGVLIGLYGSLEQVFSRLRFSRIVLRSFGILFVVVTAILQFQFVRYETSTSSREFQVYRQAIAEWVDRMGWHEGRLIVILRPQDATTSVATNARPRDVETALGTFITRTDGPIPFARGSAWLASADNPASIPWMVTAALREKADQLPTALRKVVSCGADEHCMSTALDDPSSLVIGYVDSSTDLTVPVSPLIIDVSALTKHTNQARVTLGPSTSISASSQFQELGPDQLLSSGQPGWHAKVPAEYPQSLLFDFGETEDFESISLTPQDGHFDRMPSRITVEFSENGNKWYRAVSAEQHCQDLHQEFWRVPFPRRYEARLWRVTILDNCGNPEYLTLRGLTFD